MQLAIFHVSASAGKRNAELPKLRSTPMAGYHDEEVGLETSFCFAETSILTGMMLLLLFGKKEKKKETKR